jgi:hypothetical protein
MPYVRDGAVVSHRSPYRLSIVTDIFWSVVNLIAALCVPARAPSTRSRTRLRLRARLRFVALTPVSLLSDTRAARPKQLSVHARPRVRGVVRREAAAKARGRVRRQRRRRLGRRRGGPGGRRRRPPRRKRARRFPHPRARPQRASGGRLRQVGVFRAAVGRWRDSVDSHARRRAVSILLGATTLVVAKAFRDRIK